MSTAYFSRDRVPACLLTAALFASCDSRSTAETETAPPVLSALSVDSTRTSPAVIRFELADAESDQVDLSFTVRRADGSLVSASLVPGEFADPDTGLPRSANPSSTGLDAPQGGRSYALLWDFATDVGPGVHDVELVPDVSSRSSKDAAAPANDALQVRVGNEAPVVELSRTFAGPESGVIRIPLRVRDARADQVAVRIDYRIAADAACVDYLPARDALLSTEVVSSEPLLVDAPEGAEEWAGVEFLWDSAYLNADAPAMCQLHDVLRTVDLRVTVSELLADQSEEALSTEILVEGLVIDNVLSVTAPEDESSPDEDEDDPDGGGDDPGDDDPDGSEDDPDDDADPFAAWLRHLASTHRWIVPFLEIPELREAILIASRMSPTSLAVADIDADGNLDIVHADTLADLVNVHYQIAPGVVATTPVSLGGIELTRAPIAVAAADLDGDRDLDVASGNFGADDVTIFFQTSPSDFDRTPARLTAPSELRPMRLRPFDVDRDGDLDLVVEDESHNVTGIFLQARPGVFRFAEPAR